VFLKTFDVRQRVKADFPDLELPSTQRRRGDGLTTRVTNTNSRVEGNAWKIIRVLLHVTFYQMDETDDTLVEQRILKLARRHKELEEGTLLILPKFIKRLNSVRLQQARLQLDPSDSLSEVITVSFPFPATD